MIRRLVHAGVTLWCAGVLVCAPCVRAAAPAAGAWVRLRTPLSSASPVGTRVVARGLTALGAPSLAGCDVEGAIAESGTHDGRRVLRVAFTRVTAPAGGALTVALNLDAVDNAREAVGADGRILGLERLRRRPSAIEDVLLLVAHAHPLLAVSEEGARILLRAGEHPAIAFAAGTDLHLHADAGTPWPPPICVPPPSPPALALDDAVPDAWPRRTAAGEGRRPADWIKRALAGSADDVRAAFARAGWTSADRSSLRADARTFVAVAERHGYATGPVSLLTLEGAPPALVFQRTTNTFAARHHVRVWGSTLRIGGRPLWFAAATHDIAIEFSRTTHRLTHRIDGLVDDERDRLAADLVDAGVVAALASIDRPFVDRTSTNAAGDPVTTDGRLIVVRLAATPD